MWYVILLYSGCEGGHGSEWVWMSVLVLYSSISLTCIRIHTHTPTRPSNKTPKTIGLLWRFSKAIWFSPEIPIERQVFGIVLFSIFTLKLSPVKVAYTLHCTNSFRMFRRSISNIGAFQNILVCMRSLTGDDLRLKLRKNNFSEYVGSYSNVSKEYYWLTKSRMRLSR